MASTNKYLSHLLQNTGITPACSEEERAAADVIAKVFANHGFEPEMQEFSASGAYKVVQAALGIAAFLGAVLMGISGPIGIVGLLLAVAAAVLYWIERSGRPVLSGLGRGGLSQNVIAYHKASGPLASPRNRPVVVVAHYDSPRVDFLAQQPYAAYRPLLVKLLPVCMSVPAAFAVLHMLPFPGAAKTVLWLLAIVAALVPLAHAVAVIANRFVLPYTTGSVCNKSSVAAMLGVMDAVAPFGDAEEFPEDTPAEEYFAEQERIVEEAARAAAEAEEAAAAAMYPHEQEAAAESDEAPEADGVGDALEVEGEDALASELDAEATGLFELPADAVGADGDEALAADVVPGSDSVTADPSSTIAMQMHEVAADSTQISAVGAAGEVSADGAPQAADEVAGVDEAAEADDLPYGLSSAGAIRFGADVVRGLNMLPASCAVVYEDDLDEGVAPAAEVHPADVVDDRVVDVAPEQDVAVPLAAEQTEMAVTEPEPEPKVSPEPSLFDEEAGAVQQELPVEFESSEGLTEPVPMSDDAPRETSNDDFTERSDVEDGVLEQLMADDAAGDDAPAAEVENVAPAGNSGVAMAADQGATQLFEVVPTVQETPEHTVAMPAQPQPVETVDSLMAEISRPVSAPTSTAASALHIPNPASAAPAAIPATANRASLFDLPDPLASNDPFAAPTAVPQPQAAPAPSFSVVDPVDVPSAPVQAIEMISAPAPVEEKPRRGLGRLFGRKKKHDDSMSDWLGVDDGFDAKGAGSDIGSWDNFDDDGWKGGAAGLVTMSEDELRDAITSMGDDELLGHDIWFVATGASECGNAGMKAFLDEHRDKLRGVFLINLESIGAGTLATLTTEGRNRVLKGDRRIGGLVSRVSADFHQEFARVEMPHVATDAYAAMELSLRSLTIAGVDETGFALSHTGDDQPYNVDPENVSRVADVVTEVIRRS